MKKILFFLLIFNLFSCSSKKEIETYKIMRHVVKDLKDPFYNEKLKTIDIVDYSSVLNKEFVLYLRNYMLNRKPISSSHDLDIYWTTKKDEFILSEKQMKFMINEVAKNNRVKWDLSKLKIDSLQINLLEFPDMENCKSKNDESEKRIKNKTPLFLISAPIFDSKKKIAVIKIKYVYLNMQNTMIFKKDKKNWKLIAQAPYSLF